MPWWTSAIFSFKSICNNNTRRTEVVFYTLQTRVLILDIAGFVGVFSNFGKNKLFLTSNLYAKLT